MIRAISGSGLVALVACLAAFGCVEYDPQLPDLGPLPDASSEVLPEPMPEPLPEPAPDLGVDAGDAEVGSDVDVDSGDADPGSDAAVDAGLDHDMDVDEGVECVATDAGEAIGGPCSAGLGACRADGLWRCEGGVWRCDAEPAAPTGEACNDVDDDCDGAVDEDFDLLNDAQNCNGCGNDCAEMAEGLACYAGACLPACATTGDCERGSLCAREPGVCRPLVEHHLRPFDPPGEPVVDPTDFQMGVALGMAGDSLIAGAPRGVRGSQTGVAYTFARDEDGEWRSSTRLYAWLPGNLNGGLFGSAVAVDGGWAAVGAPSDSRGPDGQFSMEDDFRSAGTVYLYRRVGADPPLWTQAGFLTGFGNNALFGSAVALDGNRLLVGARGQASGESFSSGRVFVFDLVEGPDQPNGQWIPAGDFGADDPIDEEFFGTAIDLDGDRAVVGTGTQDPANQVVYIFENSADGWSQVARLTPEEGEIFGRAVTIHGSHAAVSSYVDRGQRAGIRLFERGADGRWSAGDRLVALNTGVDAFNSISLSGDRLLVGCPTEDARFQNDPMIDGEGEPDSGAAYVFEREDGGWQQVAYIKASPGRAGDRFGTVVDLDGDRLAVAAPQEGAQSIGAVYVYDFAE